MVKLYSSDSHLQYKVFIAQFCRLVMSISQWTCVNGDFRGACVNGTITFSESCRDQIWAGDYFPGFTVFGKLK